ncbi:nucleotide pyrophosphohydrolase [Bacilli bacterium]|nr:nucleotide pyrophosphohydrolase [Bacilli bacterium]GHU41168.1 nucleotide pyrophosphohydrolase [Bacilli bacterium]
MTELTFKSLQDYLTIKYDAICQQKNISTPSTSDLFIKLVEEIGEVAEVLSQQKGNKASTDDASLEKELADVIHYVVEIANVNAIDLTKAIIEKDKLASVKYNQSLNLADFLAKD